MPNTLGTSCSKYDGIHIATEVQVYTTCHGMPYFTQIVNKEKRDRPRSLNQEDDAKRGRLLLLLPLLTCFSWLAARA